MCEISQFIEHIISNNDKCQFTTSRLQSVCSALATLAGAGAAAGQAPCSAPGLRYTDGISRLETLAGAGAGVPPGVQLLPWLLAQLLC